MLPLNLTYLTLRKLHLTPCSAHCSFTYSINFSSLRVIVYLFCYTKIRYSPHINKLICKWLIIIGGWIYYSFHVIFFILKLNEYCISTPKNLRYDNTCLDMADLNPLFLLTVDPHFENHLLSVISRYGPIHLPNLSIVPLYITSISHPFIMLGFITDNFNLHLVILISPTVKPLLIFMVPYFLTII